MYLLKRALCVRVCGCVCECVLCVGACVYVCAVCVSACVCGCMSVRVLVLSGGDGGTHAAAASDSHECERTRAPSA